MRFPCMKSALIPAIAFAVMTFAPIPELTSTAEAQNLNRRVRIINNTNYTMISFQASNVRRNSWEEDILGRSVVRPGGNFVANINDGTGFCMFDLRAKFQGGRTAERRNVNVCSVSSWTINN